MTALLIALPLAAARPDTLQPAEPPTIEKVVIAVGSKSEIEGKGRSGNVVRLMSENAELGAATVAGDGRWRVVLTAGLTPGTYQIRADAFAHNSPLPVAGDEIRVAIPVGFSRSAVISYDGETGSADGDTRRRAEAMAEAAGRAYDDIVTTPARKNSNLATAPAQLDAPAAAAPESGALSVVIDWLKRSARGYREDVVGKLAVPTGDGSVAERTESPISANEAAKTIETQRAAAEQRRIDLAEAQTVQQAKDAGKDAERASQEAARTALAKTRRAEELKRRQAEEDRKIAEELERLKKAREEADRNKQKEPKQPAQRANITIERFYLPGEKKPRDATSGGEDAAISLRDGSHDASDRTDKERSATTCQDGRVTQRNGRRWYITGANDTLWDIAERFYGSGQAYPRIYRANRKRLTSPHVVRPCLALRLPARNR
jgi:nucleoid-associated protein YgaU